MHMAIAMMVLAAALPAAAGAGGEGAGPVNRWARLAGDEPGLGSGAVLVPIGGARMLCFGGEPAGGAACVRAFDGEARRWGDFATAKPNARRGIHPPYQTAFDPKGGKLYCLTYPGVLYTFDLAAKKWAGPVEVPELAGLSWHAMAIDPKGRRLVVVGADKRAGNLGWTRTVIRDLATGKWKTLPPPAGPIAERHRQRIAAGEAMIELIGRIRLAWYRDPKGAGTDAEREALTERCAAAGKLPGVAEFAREIEAVAGAIARRKLLAALRGARALRRKLDEQAHREYPVPASRRNSPLAFDEGSGVFVLFGGDHEDYLLNDTWVLDLARQAWRRAQPKLAPSPRAGHALVYLPAGGRLALYGGYLQQTDDGYGARAWRTIEPRQLWVYDVRAERWGLLAAWLTKRGEAPAAPPGGDFYGYHAQHFAAPALAATAADRLVLVVPKTRRQGSATWMLRLDVTRTDAAGRDKLGRPPDSRLYREGRFGAAYCEVPDAPKPTGIDKLPANRWVRLPDPPRNTAYGCRQRDWGTAVWDSAHAQILLWGGGHCVRSSSSVVHYSPVSGRMVESHDADEPYSANGNGGYDSSLLNRPWAGVHSYNHYATDPPSGLMVSGRGYFYDPRRMDWQRRERMKTPFKYVWSTTVLEATPHGAVAWARYPDEDRWGLWLLKGGRWVDLEPKGKLYKPYCDSEGVVYDAKRDRLILGWGGGYAKAGDGRLTTFDFRTRKIETLRPAGAELGRMVNTREMAYIDHADWVAFAETYPRDHPKPKRPYLRIYDCARDRYVLLDAGPGPKIKVYGQGWCYDAKRKVLFVLTYRGAPWAIRFDPATAKLLDAPPAGPQRSAP